MSITKVHVCNQALSLIGSSPITSLDDRSENARRCKLLYDQTRKALLRMHPWSCAKKRVQLAPDVNHQLFGYRHAFPLPKDFLRVIDVGSTAFEIENRHILSNANLINLVYIFDNDNEDTWDSLLVEAMALYMTHKIAKPTTGSNAEADSAWQQLQMILKQARAINGQERPSQDFSASYQSELIGVRY